MSKRAIWAMVIVCIGISIKAHAQEKQVEKTQIEVDMVWGFAQGSFGDNITRPMPGIMISFGGHVPNLPLVLSTELGWLNYGFDNYLELQFPAGSNTPAVSLINAKANNSILMAHLVGRFTPFNGKITPYLDGLVGFKYLSTNIDIESEILDNNDIIAIGDNNQLLTSSTFNSFAFSYGIGAGIDFQILKGPLGLNNRNTTISMNIGARYLFGTETNYLPENSIRSEAGSIRFEQIESNTNILIPKFGLRLEL